MALQGDLRREDCGLVEQLRKQVPCLEEGTEMVVRRSGKDNVKVGISGKVT